MEIIHIALKTGFNFKNTFGHLEKTIEFAHKKYIGVADIGNSYAHAGLEKACIDKKLNPIYGVRLTVVPNATEQVKPRGQFGHEHLLLAKNGDGLKEIYSLIKVYYENFYFRGNISQHDINELSKNVFVIAATFEDEKRIDFIALAPNSSQYYFNQYPKIPRVAMVDNYYPTAEDRTVYQNFTSPRNTNTKTYPQYILSTIEWRLEMKRRFKNESKGKQLKEAIKNTHLIAKACKVVLEKAPMIKYDGPEKIEFLCRRGAKRLGIDIKNKGEYKDRYEREMKVIKEKDFDDYFLVVTEIVKLAKKRMLVGPARGSAAGSLVCFLLGITEVDPIPYGLLFERFIDINRNDLPDIDIDFPDDKRDSVVKNIIKTYGEERVKHIAIVSRMQPRVALNEFAKALRIPVFELEEIKGALIERPEGDSRFDKCLKDTFETIETGKDFIEEFPQMKSVEKIEGHPRHHGVHAAGVIVCNEPIENFAGVSVRDDTVMVDKVEAEYLNLLKIDILGLRTLSVLADAAKQVGMDYHDFYSLPLDDEKVYKIFNDMRVAGIFQFEGYALSGLTRKMGVENFNDIVAITALARPAALQSGGANRYVKYRTGEEAPQYINELHKKITGETFGILVFQEQILNLCREVGKMSWADVNAIRKALSKSYGEEYFSKYKEDFISGAEKNKIKKDDAEFLWSEIAFSGSYAFNKSHSVSYGLISYWTAYMKAYHPLEFLVANLNNSRDDHSAIKILRDAVKNDGIEYCALDPDESGVKWTVKNGIVLGGLLNLDGVGVAKANKIIEARAEGKATTKNLSSKLINPKTKFDILFPTEHYWSDIFKRPEVYGLPEAPSLIRDIEGQGNYCFIGKLTDKNIKDLNEYASLAKRNGEILSENNLQMTITVEDDTDSIMAFINRFSFPVIGEEIAHNGIIDESWYIIRGEIKFDSRFVFIEDIDLLTEEILDGYVKPKKKVIVFDDDIPF